VTKNSKESLIKSLDRLSANGKQLIPLVLNCPATLRRGLSKNEWNQLLQWFPKAIKSEHMVILTKSQVK